MVFKLNLFYTYKKLKILNCNLGCFPFELKPLNFNSNYWNCLNLCTNCYLRLSYKNVLFMKNWMSFIVFKYFQCSTKIIFVKNQLYPSLISLSPLIISHLSLLQQTRVRTSFSCLWLDHLVSGLIYLTIKYAITLFKLNYLNFAK